MSTLELFVDTIILTLAIGVILGGLAMELLVVRPLRARHAREHKRVLNAFRQGAERAHLGTPYIVPAPLPDEVAHDSWVAPIPAGWVMADLSDNDRWSRKTPELVSLPAPRVQTGRPV